MTTSEPLTDTADGVNNAAGSNGSDDATARPPLAPAPTSEKKKDDGASSVAANGKTETKARTWWRLPSLPILKILQGTFLILMIGQSLPGAQNSFWPFNKSNSAPGSNSKKPLTPFYVEMRSDLYGHERQFPITSDDDGDGGLMRLLLGRKKVEPSIPSNSGVPAQQHIVLTHLNREYESFRYSVQAATTSRSQAGREFGQVSFRRALEKVLSRLTDHRDRQRLTVLEEHFLEEGGRLVDSLATWRALLVDTNNTSLDGLHQCNNTQAFSTMPFGQAPSLETQCRQKESNTNVSSTTKKTQPVFTNSSLPLIKAKQSELLALVTTFLTQISESITPGPSHAIRDALAGHSAHWGITALVEDLRTTPMRTLFSNARKRKRLFVAYFEGDVFASNVSLLRKEVTAIVRSAEPGDEVLVILHSAGGTVTGYGLVAAQLLRIKEAGLAMTIAVEQVAASGGYMAACVGDTIVCSPFAVVGGIGVVKDMPNIYERLKREGVEYHQITAGKYKRVLSPTKEVQPEDLKRAKDEIEDVWALFKDFVSEQRPALNIDAVATGEVWFGKRAVELGLCDAIEAADDVLTHFVDRGYDVYSVKYEEPVMDMFGKLLEFGRDSVLVNNEGAGMLGWLLQKIVAQLLVELGKIGVRFDNNRVLLV